jgi:RimJ/RimL family protein N-acetyltransferase
MWSMLVPPSLEVVGYIRLRQQRMLGGRATIGVRLGRAWWGRGFAAEALRALCGHLAARRNVRTLDLEVLAHNRRALRAYEKAGFRPARTYRRAGQLWLSLEWYAPA